MLKCLYNAVPLARFYGGNWQSYPEFIALVVLYLLTYLLNLRFDFYFRVVDNSIHQRLTLLVSLTRLEMKTG